VRVVRCALVLLVALAVQSALVADMPLFGARGDVMLLLGIAVGLLAGPDRGAVVGFVAGMSFDLVHPAPWPLGLSALAYCLAAYLVGYLRFRGVGGTTVHPALATAMGSVLGIAVFAGLGQMLDHGGLLTGRLPVVTAVVAGLNVVLLRPAAAVARWALAEPSRVLERLVR
jgi:rod shape-determining protein MreD